MAVLGDSQLFIQTILYFGSCIAGLFTCIPVGVTSINFGGNCILYGEISWTNATLFTFAFGRSANCHFPVYITVFGCIFYGMAMGCYHTYATCRSRNDPNIGSQMWAMPFILSNALMTMLLFLASCMISVGFFEWCNSFVTGAKEVKSKIHVQSCSDGQNPRIDWNQSKKTDYDASTYYSFLIVAQLACWIAFLINLVQVAMCMLRYYRNRRQRSMGQGHNIQDDVPPTAPDTQDISKVNPTA